MGGAAVLRRNRRHHGVGEGSDKRERARPKLLVTVRRNLSRLAGVVDATKGDAYVTSDR
jgi:hypothetical protein